MVLRIMALSILFFALISPQWGYAGAWALKKDEYKSYTSVHYYTSSKFFDEYGDVHSGLDYKKILAEVVQEYGYTDVHTIGMKMPYVYHQISNGISDHSVSGIANFQIYSRHQLLNDKKYGVFSLQPMIEIPPTNDDSTLPLDSDVYDIELRALYGKPFKIKGNNSYVNLEAGYLNHLDGTHNEIKIDTTFGIELLDDLVINVQSFSTISSPKMSSSSYYQSSVADYNETKLQFSVVKAISKKFSLEVGAYKDVYGKNRGKGDGIFFSIWTRFDSGL